MAKRDDEELNVANDTAAVTWSDLGIAPLPEHAPSWRLVSDLRQWLVVRGAVVGATWAPIAGSKRWRIHEHFFRIPESGEDLEGMSSSDQPGALMCFVDRPEPGEPPEVSAPGFVLATALHEDEGLISVTTLADGTLLPVPVMSLPFPVDVALLEARHTVVAGLVRRTLMGRWSLDVLCPRCADLGRDAVSDDGTTPEGVLRCGRCHHTWPEEARPGTMEDAEADEALGWWSVPVAKTLNCLTRADWRPDPFVISWEWDDGAQLSTHYRLGRRAIKVTLDAETMVLTLLGPLELGPEGISFPTHLGPNHARKVLAPVLGVST